MTEKLWRGIGCVSDRTLAGSDEENVRRYFRMRRRNRRIWCGTVAACLCLVAVLCSVLIPGQISLRDSDPEGGDRNAVMDSWAPGSSSSSDVPSASDGAGDAAIDMYVPGNTARCVYGTLNYLSYDGDTVTLRLVKETDDEIHISFRGYTVLPGEAQPEEDICLTTDPGLRDSGSFSGCKVLPDPLPLTVNGVYMEDGSIPREAGIYTITVNVSSLRAENRRFAFFTVDGFGLFSLS